MQEQVQKVKQGLAANIDKRIVVSTVVASLTMGVIVYALNKTNVKALQSLGKLAK